MPAVTHLDDYRCRLAGEIDDSKVSLAAAQYPGILIASLKDLGLQ
jgi:hypothetical protein